MQGENQINVFLTVTKDKLSSIGHAFTEGRHS